jgi:hypothetical protein
MSNCFTRSQFMPCHGFLSNLSISTVHYTVRYFRLTLPQLNGQANSFSSDPSHNYLACCQFLYFRQFLQIRQAHQRYLNIGKVYNLCRPFVGCNPNCPLYSQIFQVPWPTLHQPDRPGSSFSSDAWHNCLNYWLPCFLSRYLTFSLCYRQSQVGR